MYVRIRYGGGKGTVLVRRRYGDSDCDAYGTMTVRRRYGGGKERVMVTVLVRRQYGGSDRDCRGTVTVTVR